VAVDGEKAGLAVECGGYAVVEFDVGVETGGGEAGAAEKEQVAEFAFGGTGGEDEVGVAVAVKVEDAAAGMETVGRGGDEGGAAIFPAVGGGAPGEEDARVGRIRGAAAEGGRRLPLAGGAQLERRGGEGNRGEGDAQETHEMLF